MHPKDRDLGRGPCSRGRGISKTEEALLEEVRVLSVMMSRARHGLVLTHAAFVTALVGHFLRINHAS